jgi:hypothetical protein
VSERSNLAVTMLPPTDAERLTEVGYTRGAGHALMLSQLLPDSRSHA